MARRHKDQNPFSLFAFQDIITSICGIVVLLTLLLAMELSIHIVADDSPETSPSPTQEDIDHLHTEIDQLQAEVDRMTQALQEKNEETDETILMTVPEMDVAIQKMNREIQIENEKKNELIQQEQEAKNAVKQSQQKAAEAEKLKGQIESLRRELAEIRNIAEKLKDNNFFYFGHSTDITEMPWLVQISGDEVIATSLAADSNEEKKFSGEDADTQFLFWAKTRDKNKEYFVLLARPSGIDAFNRISDELEPAGYKIGVDFIGESLHIEISNKGETE